jgi:DNA-binding transcriptional LysR family regulator
MNLFDAYRYLAALAQHRHFGRAAAACHITQPALSNALRSLESHLEVAIVRRGRQYEGLTPEGEQVLASAHRALREQEALRQELAGSAGLPRGRLVIGAVPTAVPVAARFAGWLVERHPGLNPQVRSLASQEIESGLVSLAIDIGLGYTERVSNGAQTWPQYVEHYFVLRRTRGAGTAFRFGAPMRWAEAAQLPLAMLTPEMHNRAILDRAFRSQGAEVVPVLETNSVMALLVALQGSALAAVLPGAVVATVAGQRGLEALPLVDPELRTPIGIMSADAASSARRSRALEAALRVAVDPEWLAHVGAHSGPLGTR